MIAPARPWRIGTARDSTPTALPEDNDVADTPQTPLRILSLCSGIGGLEQGIGRAVPTRVVGYVERETYAASVLVARMEDTALDRAPIWVGDIRELDARPLRGHADLICCGYPCQPFSQAGQRKGDKDDRHIWPDVARIIGEVGPSFVFLENVTGHIRLGFDQVLSDLATLGYDAEWTVVRASDPRVGSPHRRERLFCLAKLENAECPRWEGDHAGFRVVEAEGREGASDQPQRPSLTSYPGVAHPNRDGRAADGQGGGLRGVDDCTGPSRREGGEQTLSPQRSGQQMADTDSGRCQVSGLKERPGLEGQQGGVLDGCRDDGGLDGETVADTEREQPQRSGDPGDMAGPPGATEGQGLQQQRGRDAVDDSQQVVADTEWAGRGAEQPGRSSPGGEVAGGGGPGLADTEGVRGDQPTDGAGSGAPGSHPPRQELDWPPGPDGDWSGIPEWLWPALENTPREPERSTGPGERCADTEGGGSHGAPPGSGIHGDGQEQAAPIVGNVRGVADGLAYRVDRLRCLGNAVIPAQSAAAFLELIERYQDE